MELDQHLTTIVVMSLGAFMIVVIVLFTCMICCDCKRKQSDADATADDIEMAEVSAQAP